MTKKVTVEGAEGAADDIWQPASGASFSMHGNACKPCDRIYQDPISPIGGSGLEQQEEE